MSTEKINPLANSEALKAAWAQLNRHQRRSAAARERDGLTAQPEAARPMIATTAAVVVQGKNGIKIVRGGGRKC